MQKCTYTLCNDNRLNPIQRLTNGATVSLVRSYHQSRASTVVHCVDLCPMAKYKLKSRDILSKCSSMQWGSTDGDSPNNYYMISVKASGALAGQHTTNYLIRPK